MLRHRRQTRRLRITPDLDDRPLRRVLAEMRPSHQLHGLGADTGRAPWRPVAELLHDTGTDWDRRTHRISVIAAALPPVLADRWAAACPDSADAAVVRAHVQADRATETGAARAEQLCVQAGEAFPADPTPWIALLSLLRARQVPVRHVWPVWHEITVRDPANRHAHHELLRLLSPRGAGSLTLMNGFARSAADAAPPGSPLALLPLAARTEHYGHRITPGSPDALGVGMHWYEPGVAADIEHALDHWFRTAAAPHAQAMTDLNLLAFALTRAHRLTEASPVFRRIGPYMTPHPWNLVPDQDPVATFRYWTAGHTR